MLALYCFLGMKRIYLDWNVYSNLKRESFSALREKLISISDEVLIPYSSAHFDDLMKSWSLDNDFFKKDIETLSTFSKDHLLIYEYNKGIFPAKCSPQEYQKSHIGKENIGELMNMETIFDDLSVASNENDLGDLGEFFKLIYKLQPAGIEIDDQNNELLAMMFPGLTSNSSMWDFMKEFGPFVQNLLQNRDYYKDFRRAINKEGFKLDQNSGNWDSNEVINNIDQFLEKIGANMSYDEIIKSTLSYDKQSNDFFTEFTTSYNMLDMIGYKSDKLSKKTDTFQNIATDGEHAYFAAYCDLFIVGDKKLSLKAQSLYHKYSIETLILSPDDFLKSFDELINGLGKADLNPIVELGSHMKDEYLVKYKPIEEDHPAEVFVYKLPYKYFDFFTHLVHRIYPGNGHVLTLKFAKKYQSKFIFYTEVSSLFDQIARSLGLDVNNYDELKRSFVDGADKFGGIYWEIKNGVVILEYPEGEFLPTLSYLIGEKKE